MLTLVGASYINKARAENKSADDSASFNPNTKTLAATPAPRRERCATKDLDEATATQI